MIYRNIHVHVSVFPAEWFYRNNIVHVCGFYFPGQFSAGAIVGIIIGSTTGFWFIVLVILAFPFAVCLLRRYHSKEVSPGTYMYINFVPILHVHCVLPVNVDQPIALFINSWHM